MFTAVAGLGQLEPPRSGDLLGVAAAWEECQSKRALWERIREIFHQFQVPSMQTLYTAMLAKGKPPLQVLKDL